uniref:Uncharacterized protein n=1 Tax=Kwoniella dejecticola CBS 10117 TaxID=1296121 RepID=A0A1A5ZW69_9TREE|nr:uncharacterized protein I303_07970 [Kwoniella dejecticola CBS 10117]OBR82056.1 hypothetical protein I303_07970 [Kwoniella dejecticola CBS 10117]
MPPSYPVPTQMVQQLWGKFITWLMRSYPLKDYPLNIRPGMVFATATWIIILGILGMAPLPELPLNDKALHFFGLGFATFLLYFILEVPDGAGRRIWYIRRAPIIFTLVTAFFWKEFQFGDIIANLLGSTLFLYLAHLLHQRNIRKMELSSLYQPLNAQTASSYRDAQGRRHQFNNNVDVGVDVDGNSSDQPPRENVYSSTNSNRPREGSGVWDEESDFGRSSQDTARGYNDCDNDNGGSRQVGEPSMGSNVFDLGDEDEDDHIRK